MGDKAQPTSFYCQLLERGSYLHPSEGVGDEKGEPVWV